MFNTRATRSNPALALPTGNLGHILCKLELSFRSLCNCEGPGHVSNDECEPIHTLEQAFKSLDCEGLSPPQTARTPLVLVAVNPEIEFDPHICEYI